MSDSAWTVSKEDVGLNLFHFLKKQCKKAPSIKAIKRAIDGKQCAVNGQLQTFSSFLLKEGDHVALDLILSKPPQQVPIFFEDDHLVICNKRSGICSDPPSLAPFFPKLNTTWQLVHRLDKETTGALILAKSAQVKERMVAQFKKYEVGKSYLAIVDRPMKQNEGIIDRPLHLVRRYQGQAVYGVTSSPKGQRAVTAWRCLHRGKQESIVGCAPKTGRTHQLRVHLSYLGHPILGDTQYGHHFHSSFLPKRHLLHAYKLQFTHPMTEERIEVIAPIPTDFNEICRAISDQFHPSSLDSLPNLLIEKGSLF